ncbi:fumarylacetoacetate hydrolase family protein [Virgibacillus sp. W0181]|uniref:fumarylacetoacetate hydrolase family protein n=1 Tax=Virgibacillus sp. W0181 TaxID=3391581 RepID=UPI003F47F109
MATIKNIYCVGRNFHLHAVELGNKVPSEPLMFTKPTHALVKAKGQDIALPGDMGEVHYEVELVIHIGNKIETDFRLEDIIDCFSLGIDFTLRDVQSNLKQGGKPWLLAKGFPNSALIGEFLPFESIEKLSDIDFTLLKNNQVVQTGNVKEMIFDLIEIISYTKKHFGLSEGDIIYTGTPAGVGKVTHGDQLEMYWGDQLVGGCRVRMNG